MSQRKFRIATREMWKFVNDLSVSYMIKYPNLGGIAE
jgi:hypothetical protein